MMARRILRVAFLIMAVLGAVAPSASWADFPFPSFGDERLPAPDVGKDRLTVVTYGPNDTWTVDLAMNVGPPAYDAGDSTKLLPSPGGLNASIWSGSAAPDPGLSTTINTVGQMQAAHFQSGVRYYQYQMYWTRKDTGGAIIKQGHIWYAPANDYTVP